MEYLPTFALKKSASFVGKYTIHGAAYGYTNHQPDLLVSKIRHFLFSQLETLVMNLRSLRDHRAMVAIRLSLGEIKKKVPPTKIYHDSMDWFRGKN